ncbi:MAG: TlpA family protein disulfide reductase [Bacteroidales bacterium]|nr:TlpA family protein disulfide reductase [Bacteroidales bacterium]
MNRLWYFIFISVMLLSCAQSREKKDAEDGDQEQAEQKQESSSQESNEIESSTLIAEGEAVPDFSFTTTRGRQYSMEGLEGKVVLLNFFATWCPTCMKEMPALQEQVWSKYKDRDDFILVSIGREQGMQKMKDFKAEKGYGFHFAPDTGRVIYSMFAEKYIPRNVVVNEQGAIVYQGTGYDEQEFASMLQLIERELAD